ncbi:LytTR family transcriptional regulator DNA-binding domain-containing protein [Paenibacillus sp. AGC30]
MDLPIGKYLEYLRLSCGYSLREAAKRTSLSHGYIRDVELGDNNTIGNAIIPRPQTLQKFASAYTASFNELMQIAGHVSSIDKLATFEFIELNFENVLYLEVGTDNRIIYHQEKSRVLTERLSLHDFIKFEEQLENNEFLRVQSGLYANLKKIKVFDKKSLKLYFNEQKDGHFVSISWIRASKLNKTILNAINKNNENVNKMKSEPPPFIRIIRNILTE